MSQPETLPTQRRALYLMAKPPVDRLRDLAGLARRCRQRPLDLAHVTLLGLGDLPVPACGRLARLTEAMDGFAGTAFPLSFDHIGEVRVVALRFSKPMRSARRFQRELGRFLLARGVDGIGKPPVPHLTINYRRDGLGDEAITPIGWTVQEVQLIESIHGRATHVVHGCWPLTQLLV